MIQFTHHKSCYDGDPLQDLSETRLTEDCLIFLLCRNHARQKTGEGRPGIGWR